MMKLRVLTAAAVVCVASCGSPGPFGTSEDIELVELGRLPPPTRADLSVDSRPYLIGPFDKLRVDVFGVEELSGEVQADASRSEEHTSELQSLMRISYAVFCFKKKKN